MTLPPYNPFDDLPGLLRAMHLIAASVLAGFRGTSLQPGDLVNTIFADLYREAKADWKNHDYFFGAVRLAMREHMISRLRKTHGVVLTQIDSEAAVRELDALSATTSAALREALDKLNKTQPEWVKILVEYCLVGETEADIARKLNMGLSTVKRNHKKALAALAVALGIVVLPTTPAT